MDNQDFVLVKDGLNRLVDKLKNAKIYLTGGTGVFGKNLISSFVRLNSEMNLGSSMTVLARNTDKFLSSHPEFNFPGIVDFVSGDVRDFIFPKEKYDFIIHAATPVSRTLEIENPAEMESTIVDGTKRVVDFANFCGAEKLLLTSSGAIYGNSAA